MFKTIVTVACAISGLALVVLPAQAADVHRAAVNCDTGPSIKGSENQIATELVRKGYHVTGVEEWNHCVRAFVVKPDGTQSMAFFEPGSLKPIAVG